MRRPSDRLLELALLVMAALLLATTTFMIFITALGAD